MKKLIVLPFFLFTLLPLLAQSSDPVIMTIAGQPVHRSEFEYSYNKNNTEGVIDKKTVEEYVDLFVNYKLKVQAALDAKLDTMISYQKEFRTYRDQQILPTFVTDADVEKEARKVYQNTKDAIGPRGLIMPAHILVLVKQKATEAEQQEAKRRTDSIYNALKQGADFAELAKKVSQDPGSAQKGGTLPWIGPNQTLKEFEEAAYALQVGEMSQPVLSPAGWHIILMKDRKQLEPYDSLRSDILQFLEARNVRDHLSQQVVDSLAKQRGITQEELLDERSAALQAEDADLDNLVREYHDGLLLYEISNRKVWEKAAKDETGLEEYFNNNRKKYKWMKPRYKGMVYHVKDKADVKAVKKCVKDLDFEDWADALRKTFNSDSIIRIRVEKGIFKKGDNAFIDKMVFKQKDAAVTPLKDYPIDAVFGKKLTKPQNYQDVRGLVVADYQEALEKEWVKDLRSQYSVVVNQDVLKTVNKHEK